MPRQRPVISNAFDTGGAFDQPSYSGEQDLLGPLIMRTSFANGYAAAPERTRAQNAASALATGDVATLQSALERAAARRADEVGAAHSLSVTVVRLGAFADDENAARVARDFSRYGKTAISVDTNGARALSVVDVQITTGVTVEAVVKAAAAVGLKGAFTLR